ncbi:unnamed protein product [Protopolystoma xenopodis]|uniref:Cadherin domain-containing protein n=1 Tax=Protopolystoma xenopodis TaxID=117903 RepID=A0A448W9U5_9PLAT|nr:unnamed protein product [Protopolystoma xenopodis]
MVHAVSTREVLVPDPGIYLICVRLQDNGLPSLSSEASFWLRIAQPASKEDLLHDSAEGGSSSDFSQPFIHLPNGRSSHLPEARFGSSEGLDASLTGVTGSDNSNATLRSGKRGMSAVFNSNTRLDDSSLITSKITGLSMARFSLGDTLSSAIVLVLVIVFCVALACALVAGGLWIRSRRLAVYRLRRHQQQYHQRHTEKDSSAKLQTTHNLNVNDGIITETGSIERAGRERKGEDWDNLNEQAELKFELNNSQKRNGSKMGVSTSQIYGLLTSTPFEADATQLEIDPLMRVNSFRNSASSFEKQNDLELTRDYCSIKTVTLPTSKTQPTVFLSTTASPPMASNSYVNASSISSTNRAHSKASELVCLQQLSTISGANQELLNTRDMSSLIGHTIQSSCSSGLSPASLVYVTLPKMAGSICPGIYAAYPEGLSTALSSSTLPATTPFSTPPPLSTGASCSKTSDLASLSTPISAIDFGLHGSTPIASPSSISEQKLSLYFDPSTGGNVSYLQDSSETDKTDQSNTNPLFNLQQPQCIPSTILMPKGLLDLHLIQAISTPEAQSPQMPSTTSLQSKFAVQRARNMDLNERDAGIDEDSSLLVANCLNSESQNFIAVSQVRNLPLI